MRFKKAFTLAEIVMFFLIISILVAIILNVTKPKDAINLKITRTKYANVYDTLNQIMSELVDKDETNPFVSLPSDTYNNPYRKLCEGMVSFINTDGSQRCATGKLNPPYKLVSDENTDFTGATARITSLTGVAFYMTDLIEDDISQPIDRSYFDTSDPAFKLKFFMIYVDLNPNEHKNRPHTIKYNSDKKILPDVFAFAALPTGDVIPIGIAEYDTSFLSSKIAYRENKRVKLSEESLSYHDAKHLAWNYYSTGSQPVLQKSIAYTYNDFIKEILVRNGSKLYEFNKDGVYPVSSSRQQYSKCVPPVGSGTSPYSLCALRMETPFSRDIE